MKRISTKSIISVSILLLTCCGIVYYLSLHWELLNSLWNISLTQVVILIILRTLYTSTYGLFLKISIAKLQIRLKPREWFGLPFITTMGNQLTPFAGGVIMRAMYLKHRHSLSYTQFATLLFANHLITFWVAGCIGMLTCVFSPHLGRARWILIIFFSIMVVVIAIIVSLPPHSLSGQNRVIKTINNFFEGWAILKEDKTLLIQITFIVFIGVMLNGLSFGVAFYAIDLNALPQTVLLVSLLPFFLILIYITPGNLGVQEIIISITSGFVGTGLGKGLLVALLIRATTLIPVFSLGMIYSLLLANDLSNYQPSPSVSNRSNNLAPRQLIGRLRYLFGADKDR
jgi:uncharacterized membrane protein YbhN (UPF0104 family)